MRIAIDTGGTFTDCVYSEGDDLRVLKVPSTPYDPAAALLQAVSVIAPHGALEVRHGTTVGTNALLERKGARVAFITTEGFEDTIAIGRQNRPKLYDLLWAVEPPLAPAEMRFGAAERTSSDGTLLKSISDTELERLLTVVSAAGPESIAISFLFSFANPKNERTVAAALRKLAVPVSVSHEILPEFREYERGSTTLINAYLAPKMRSYLRRIEEGLSTNGSQFRVMQSSGGIISAAIASEQPVRTILSGPAGGVVGAMTVARQAGHERILTFDMGGTSTDVALINGQGDLQATRETMVMGMPVAVPMLNIHTVGAGGGSIATFDRGGALRVGPESAGADPGPLCYGKGSLPTVTDANLLLGRLSVEGFLGGTMRLDEKRAREFFSQTKGSMETVEHFAEGIVRVADSHMEKALRRISVERGYDPRDFTLISFGGAGPLHSVALARALRIERVLVPRLPGALSSYGILVSDLVRDYSRTVMLSSCRDLIEGHFQDLEASARSEMEAENIPGSLLRSLDVRYAGQGYELEVPWSLEFLDNFHQIHERRYGYSDRSRPVQVVNVRVRAVARTGPVSERWSLDAIKDFDRALINEKQIFYEGAWHHGRVYDRSLLHAGSQVAGPAILVEYSATTFLPPSSAASVDEKRNLIIQVNA